MLEQKTLGRTGLKVSAIGLGCVTFGREIDEDQSYRIMDYAVERGITFFDTSEAYGGGQAVVGIKGYASDSEWGVASEEMSSSERIIGTWMKLRDCRDEITICTKVNTGGSSENIPRALSASLARLQTDYTNIYKMHSPDQTVPIEETLEAMTAEIRAGRVLIAGCSNYSNVQLGEALDASASHGYTRFEVTQPSYSLAAPEAQEDLFPLCTREGVAVTPYGPLGSGFLTGKYTSDRTKLPTGTRFHISPGHADVYFSDRNFRVVEKLRAKTDDLGMPMVKLAMAWAMTHPSVTSVLIGARETRHIDNALAAYEMGLDPNLRAEMSAWS